MSDLFYSIFRRKPKGDEPKKTNQFFLLSRLHRALKNGYPFTEHPDVPILMKDNAYKKFYKEKLNDIFDYNKKLKNEKAGLLQTISAIFAIATTIITIVAFFSPTLIKFEKDTLVFCVVLVNLALILFFCITLILVWNDKKNYSYYYEELLKNYVLILEADNKVEQIKVESLNRVIDFLQLTNFNIQTIISHDIHFLNEKLRDLDYYTCNKSLKNMDQDKILSILMEYLDKLCVITRKINLFDYKTDTITEAEYSSCIKLLNKKHIFSQVPLNDLEFKTLVRSSRPNTSKYRRRLKEIGTKYDNVYEKVADNENLEQIISNKLLFSYIPDFNNMYNDNKIKHSHPESTKYYSSSVVYPIIYRVEEQKSFILGFLCFEHERPNAFPSCKERSTFNKLWEDFCCSQLDILSIFMARLVETTEKKKLNLNTTLALGKLRSINFEKYD